MQEALEHVHARFGERWRRSTATRRPSMPSARRSKRCLQSRYRGDEKKVSRRCWVLAAALVLALGGMGGVRADLHARAGTAYLDALRAEPGVVVVSASGAAGVRGQRAARSAGARSRRRCSRRPALRRVRCHRHWQMYQALEPALVVARARQLLRAPDECHVEYSRTAC